MSDNICYKEIMINYSLIIILCLFLVVYFIINYDVIHEGNLYGGNISKSIIITGVIFLILYVFLTWEDEEIEETVIIPRYKILNNVEIEDKARVNNSKGNLKIENKYNNKYNTNINDNKNNSKENSLKNSMERNDLLINQQVSSDDKIQNSNIFVTQKNKAKFGIKF